MKRVMHFITTKKKSNSKLFIMLLSFILTINLSGQKIQKMLSETWTNGNWQKSLQAIYTYDVNGYLLNILTQFWDVPSTSWENGMKSVHENNPDGTPHIVTNQIWDGVSSWINSSRSTFTYNTSKKVLTEVTEMYMAAIWQNSSKTTNTYDVSDYLTNSLSQNWDFISSSWKNDEQSIYTNNTYGYPTQEIIQTWDGVSAWNNSLRVTIVYNASNKALTETTDIWQSGEWETDSRTTNTYDGSGYILQSLYQTYNGGTSTWKNEIKEDYTNNPDGTPSEIITQEWSGTPGSWVNSNKITFTYSSATLRNEISIKPSVKIYPNPANENIRIKADQSIIGVTYSVTDHTGKLVLKGILTDENPTIDITTLTNGIYFLRMGDKSLNSYKIVKAR